MSSPHERIVESVVSLTNVVREYVSWSKGREENRPHSRLITLSDLIEMETRMAIKWSEVKTEVAALRTQVKHIWGEQQTKYDALKEKFDKLEQTLANQELDEEATKEFADFKADLQAFDDTIPEVEENPPAPEAGSARRRA